MNSVLSGFNFSLFVESQHHLGCVTAYLGSGQHFMCEMHIQLCVICIEIVTNTRVILYDFTQRSSIE